MVGLVFNRLVFNSALCCCSPQNLIAQSQSGTGKTAAFVLAMLSRVEPGNKYPQVTSLVLWGLGVAQGHLVRRLGFSWGLGEQILGLLNLSLQCSFCKQLSRGWQRGQPLGVGLADSFLLTLPPFCCSGCRCPVRSCHSGRK